eukprot:TRINITY_DN11375_c0_g1_i1.p1 TRINITY_DN11375_c0_g1~~TRINITY_DN11375_c0_g1_i1.p1  ORF type:complete len:494 (-),score=87.10 TRINITY_DN11375_c0_g1_i1:41-1522(-)
MTHIHARIATKTVQRFAPGDELQSSQDPPSIPCQRTRLRYVIIPRKTPGCVLKIVTSHSQHPSFPNSYYQHPLSKQVSPPSIASSGDSLPLTDPATLDSKLLLPLASLHQHAQNTKDAVSGINSLTNINNHLHSLGIGDAPTPRTTPTTPTSQQSKLMKFEQALSENAIDIEKLKKLSWTGIPRKYRPVVWKIMLDYVPPYSSRHEETLRKKRQEYHDWAEHYFKAKDSEASTNTELLRQILIDVPRTNPSIRLFQSPSIQRCLERILFVWSIRHPASSYVQGMNDLLTPFFVVFLSEYVEFEGRELETLEINECAPYLSFVEADCYWSFSRLLDGLHDNYTPAQPGIQFSMWKLKDIISRVDRLLGKHLEEQEVAFSIFTFRWMNCLLIREFPLWLVVRMWDTYFAEDGPSFTSFHVYVCAAFLLSWSKKLISMRNQEDIIIFLQNPPTNNWTEEDLQVMMSQAYIYMSWFRNSPQHLVDQETNSDDRSALP